MSKDLYSWKVFGFSIRQWATINDGTPYLLRVKSDFFKARDEYLKNKNAKPDESTNYGRCQFIQDLLLEVFPEHAGYAYSQVEF